MRKQDAVSAPEVIVHLLPGGKMPERQTVGAIGYDVYLRAIVSPSEMDPENPRLRKTLFDFLHLPHDPAVAAHVIAQPNKSGDMVLAYRLDPMESVLVGIGFITAMPFPLFYWVAPRSGLASRWGITVTNAPGTVDPDYRGEAGVLVYNRNDRPFMLQKDMRIAQIVFQWAVIPEFRTVAEFNQIPQTTRGAGGFGSTGL
ncbi:MAG: dUTP diphosphatase [Patescibacteria group bacterium]